MTTPILKACQSDLLRLLQSRRQTIQQARPDFKPQALEVSRNDDVLEIVFSGIVGDWWDGLSALDVSRVLREHKDASTIRVLINSPGGDYFDGVAIFNALRDHGATIETVNTALAGSAASVIFQAGDSRVMRSASQLMIHRAWTIALGNAGEMQAASDILFKLDDGAASLYAERTGLPLDEISQLLIGEGDADGTWFDADQAINLGFADETSTVQAAARQTFDFSQLGDLRIAAFSPQIKEQVMCKDDPEKPAETPPENVTKTPKDPEPQNPAPPASATFAELQELAGDDAEFIVEQQSAEATLADATKAYTARLKQQRDDAVKAATDARESARGIDESEDNPLSGGEGSQKKTPDRMTMALGDRLGRYANSLKIANTPSDN